MPLSGTERNVVDFGAFVDIGVKNDGGLHRRYILHVTVLSVGGTIEVEMVSMDAARFRDGNPFIESEQ